VKIDIANDPVDRRVCLAHLLANLLGMLYCNAVEFWRSTELIKLLLISVEIRPTTWSEVVSILHCSLSICLL